MQTHETELIDERSALPKNRWLGLDEATFQVIANAAGAFEPNQRPGPKVRKKNAISRRPQIIPVCTEPQLEAVA